MISFDNFAHLSNLVYIFDSVFNSKSYIRAETVNIFVFGNIRGLIPPNVAKNKNSARNHKIRTKVTSWTFFKLFIKYLL